MPGLFTTFTNCRLCVGGELVEGERLVVSTEDGGKILESTGFIGGEIVDLDDGIIAPGFLELQTNGVNGFHFSSFDDKESYESRLSETGKFYASQGITGFWATIPTTTSEQYQKVTTCHDLTRDFQLTSPTDSSIIISTNIRGWSFVVGSPCRGAVLASFKGRCSQS